MMARKLWLSLLATLLVIFAHAQSGPLLKTVYAATKSSGTVRFYLDEMSTRTGIRFSYSDELVKRRRRVRLKGTEHTVEEILQTILAGTGVHPAERGGKILLIPDERGEGNEQRFTICGFVKDSASREVLIGAYVYIPSLNTWTTTNTYGYYNLSVPAGRFEVIVASLGYRADTSRLTLNNDLRHDVLLPYGLALKNVTVSSQREAPVDHTHLVAKDIAAHAGLMGENDVLRALQLQPGVQTGADGSSSMLVRGGDPGQNLNLLDGTPLYYIDHFFGLTSIFNTDAVKSVDFYKGAFPARYGGRLSSIVDVASRDGNMERISGQASLGLLKGTLSLEGPIVKDKASVMLAARRTWIDGLWRPFADQLGFDFYDINTKANYIVNKSNRVYASFYTGRDQFRIGTDNEMMRVLWGNTVGAARWTSIVSPKLFVNTTATYSYFRYQVADRDLTAMPDTNGNYQRYTGTSSIRDISLRIQADYLLSAKHRLQFGAYYANADFTPAAVTFAGNPIQFAAASFRSNECLLYAEDEWKPSEKWRIRGGLHLATWISETYRYANLQPRLYVSWQPGRRHTLFGSATKMSQFLHLLNSSTSTLPADFWIPSTRNLAPEQSWLYAFGETYRPAKDVTLGAELYYKSLSNIVSYKSGNNIFENSINWEQGLTQGSGESYGAELSAKAKNGPWTASLAYTISWTWRQFEQLNGGERFPYRYDRRHNLHTELVFQKNSRFNAIASWTYMTGEAITLPDQFYPDFDNNVYPGQGSRIYTYNYASLNNYRLPAIHRLDLAVNFMRSRGKYFERTWTLGLFNAYGQRNILAVELVDDKVQGISLFRFIPTISYSVKF